LSLSLSLSFSFSFSLPLKNPHSSITLCAHRIVLSICCSMDVIRFFLLPWATDAPLSLPRPMSLLDLSWREEYSSAREIDLEMRTETWSIAAEVEIWGEEPAEREEEEGGEGGEERLQQKSFRTLSEFSSLVHHTSTTRDASISDDVSIESNVSIVALFGVSGVWGEERRVDILVLWGDGEEGFVGGGGVVAGVVEEELEEGLRKGLDL